MKQVTKDKDFVSLHDNATSIILAYNFALNDRYKHKCKSVVEGHIKANRLAPIFNTYIKLKETELRKSRHNFTEEEKQATTKEFMEIYNTANSLLRKRM